MRLDELKINEEEFARKFLKEKYPHLTEEQLNELLPLAAIGAGLGAAARVGATMGGAALRAGGKAAVTGAKALGKGALRGARALGKGAVNVGKELGKQGLKSIGNTIKDKLAQAQQSNTGGRNSPRSGGVQTSPEDMKVIQQQKKTLQAQLKANTKQCKADTTALKKQIASIK